MTELILFYDIFVILAYFVQQYALYVFYCRTRNIYTEQSISKKQYKKFCLTAVMWFIIHLFNKNERLARMLLKLFSLILDNNPRKRGDILISHLYVFSYFVQRFNNCSRSIISV